MAYVKKTWVNGELIDAAKLNNIETGISEALEKTPIKGIDYYTESDKADLLTELTKQANPLWGKKISLIGDSICSGANDGSSYLGGYGKIIADRNGMVYENLGRAGSTITAETYSSTSGAAKGWICRMVEDMSADADYAIVEGGINDAWQHYDHGNIEMGFLSVGYNATLDETTFYGAFESMLKKLITKFKGKKIGYIAVPKMMDMYDSTRNAPNFYHAAMVCCAKWGVSVCDLNNIIPPFEYIKTLGTMYTVDGTHPTYDGYLKYYCDPIEAWLKTLTTVGHVSSGAASGDLDNKYVSKNDITIKKAKLTLEDGTAILVDVVVASEGTIIISYTNQMPISIDSTKAIYNGTGWKGLTRLSASSGSVKESTSGASITGFIPVTPGATVRFKLQGDVRVWNKSTLNPGWNIMAYYDSTFTWLGSCCPLESATSVYGICTTANNTASGSVENGGVVSFTVPANENIKYLRLSFSDADNAGISSLIVTVDEEISS